MTNYRRSTRENRARSLAERLLEDGRVVDDPPAEVRQELGRLVAIGLAGVQWSRYFLCVDHGDDEALTYAVSRSCPGKVPLDDHRVDDPTQPEDDHRYVCETCDRIHRPVRHRRTLYDRATIALPMTRVEEFFTKSVMEVDKAARRLAHEPVYRVSVEDREAHVCLLDACEGSRFITPEMAATQPTIFVILAARRFSRRLPAAPWLNIVGLHEIATHGSEALRQRIVLATTQNYPVAVDDGPRPPWLPLRQPTTRVEHRLLGMHRLEVESGGALLDGVKVIDDGAPQQLAALAFFAERWSKAAAVGVGIDGHESFKPEGEVHDYLTATGHAPKSVWSSRKNVDRMRDSITNAYFSATGIRLDENEIVENVTGSGFRINPKTVFVGGK